MQQQQQQQQQRQQRDRPSRSPSPQGVLPRDAYHQQQRQQQQQGQRDQQRQPIPSRIPYPQDWQGRDEQQQQQQQKGGGDKAAETVYSALVRHALRTTGAEAVDALCKWAHVEHEAGAMSDTPTHTKNNNTKAAGAAAAVENSSSSSGGGGRVMDLVKAPPLSPAQRGVLLRALPSDAAAALAAALEAIGTACTIRDALDTLSHAAEVLGLRLKAVDKKSERAVLAQLRAELLGALSAEHDPAAALALVVPLLFMRATGKAVAVPGKTLAAVLARCSSGSSSSGRASASGLSPEALASVEAFHAQVVEHLVLMGGGGGGGTDAAARQARLAESLAQQLPAMKCLAGLEQDRE
uniref:Uncharacterized protein n=1 Tax=Dunaliella tertiolecta TaxID=3047 RepID=A0A7S3VMY6_DUNTE